MVFVNKYIIFSFYGHFGPTRCQSCSDYAPHCTSCSACDDRGTGGKSDVVCYCTQCAANFSLGHATMDNDPTYYNPVQFCTNCSAFLDPDNDVTIYHCMGSNTSCDCYTLWTSEKISKCKCRECVPPYIVVGNDWSGESDQWAPAGTCTLCDIDNCDQVECHHYGGIYAQIVCSCTKCSAGYALLPGPKVLHNDASTGYTPTYITDTCALCDLENCDQCECTGDATSPDCK